MTDVDTLFWYSDVEVVFWRWHRILTSTPYFDVDTVFWRWRRILTSTSYFNVDAVCWRCMRTQYSPFSSWRIRQVGKKIDRFAVRPLVGTQLSAICTTIPLSAPDGGGVHTPPQHACKLTVYEPTMRAWNELKQALSFIYLKIKRRFLINQFHRLFVQFIIYHRPFPIPLSTPPPSSDPCKHARRFV